MLQILSPYNKGLIRRAISQSGVAHCPWVIKKNPLFWAKRVKRNCGRQGRGLPASHSVPTPSSSARSTGLTCLPTPPHPQIAEKVGCPMDDTARMAGCLKVTDPRALTLAYKMPLAGMECEWGSWAGEGLAPGGERNCQVLSPAPHQGAGIPRQLAATPVAVGGGGP